MNVVMRMPALGAVDDMVKVLRWLVEVGQMIERGQPLLGSRDGQVDHGAGVGCVRDTSVDSHSARW